MPDESDAKQILTASRLENWRRPLGCLRTMRIKTIQQDLNETTDVTQNRPLWRTMSTFGAVHS